MKKYILLFGVILMFSVYAKAENINPPMVRSGYPAPMVDETVISFTTGATICVASGTTGELVGFIASSHTASSDAVGIMDTSFFPGTAPFTVSADTGATPGEMFYVTMSTWLASPSGSLPTGVATTTPGNYESQGGIQGYVWILPVPVRFKQGLVVRVSVGTIRRVTILWRRYSGY